MKFYIEEVMISKDKSNYFVSNDLVNGCCLSEPTTTFFSIHSLEELKRTIAETNKIKLDEVEIYDCYGEEIDEPIRIKGKSR